VVRKVPTGAGPNECRWQGLDPSARLALNGALPSLVPRLTRDLRIRPFSVLARLSRHDRYQHLWQGLRRDCPTLPAGSAAAREIVPDREYLIWLLGRSSIHCAPNVRLVRISATLSFGGPNAAPFRPKRLLSNSTRI
jgi:hypothetical protein